MYMPELMNSRFYVTTCTRFANSLIPRLNLLKNCRTLEECLGRTGKAIDDKLKIIKATLVTCNEVLENETDTFEKIAFAIINSVPNEFFITSRVKGELKVIPNPKYYNFSRTLLILSNLFYLNTFLSQKHNCPIASRSPRSKDIDNEARALFRNLINEKKYICNPAEEAFYVGLCLRFGRLLFPNGDLLGHCKTLENCCTYLVKIIEGVLIRNERLRVTIIIWLDLLGKSDLFEKVASSMITSVPNEFFTTSQANGRFRPTPKLEYYNFSQTLLILHNLFFLKTVSSQEDNDPEDFPSPRSKDVDDEARALFRKLINEKKYICNPAEEGDYLSYCKDFCNRLFPGENRLAHCRRLVECFIYSDFLVDREFGISSNPADCELSVLWAVNTL
jgi:hypothetical protein